MNLFRSFLVTMVLTLVCIIGFLPKAQAVSPAPDGGYPGGNTAEGQSALLSLTSGGYNTAVGFHSLQSNTSAAFNTAIGAGALFANNGYDNTATGALALFLNTTGGANSATGFEALFKNTTGTNNTAMGLSTLFSNTAGSDNTAVGVLALSLSTGDFNTALGYGALSNTTGSFNIALGQNAGFNLTTGDNNIDIGNAGVAGDSNAIRIGDDAHQGATFIAAVYGVAVSGLTVVMDSSDHLGTLGSSRRFKDEIKPMGTVSEAILALKPVTFRYKKEIDSEGTPQFGLVAEDVEKVNPISWCATSKENLTAFAMTR